MTQRITTEHLEAKVGFTDVTWQTDGAIHLYGAYGSTAVHQYSGTSGGSRDLSTLGTKREAAIFLSGMIAALRIAKES